MLFEGNIFLHQNYFTSSSIQLSIVLEILSPIVVICRHLTSHECTVFDLITNLGPGSRTEAVRHLELFRYIKRDITRRFEDMNFIFEWLKQYFTNEYCFHHEKIKFISSNRRVMFCLLYSCKLFETQVSNINFRSIMLKTWLYFNVI